MDRCDVAILGAGPYGLSAAAHLESIKGLEVKLFGEPMSFWAQHMPHGMFLRSPWNASHLSDPANRLSLDAYRALDGFHGLADPLPLPNFIDYGRWFHAQLGRSAERQKVSQVEPARDGYRLALDDGAAVHARRVIVAGGIQPFAHRPAIFRRVPASFVSHSSELTQPGAFRDKQVLVVGGGQSAIETAALLGEAGADVEVVIRNTVLHWVGDEWLHTLPIAWMFYGRGDVGPAGLSRLVQHPRAFQRLPRRIQDWWGRRAVRPAASYWVKPRMQGVRVRVGRFPVQARVVGERLSVILNDGTERLLDHVVLGTGYRIDVRRYPFLSPAVLERVNLVHGYPRLDAAFESTSPSLHFVGAPAAWSFGPLMRFVAGTPFTARVLRRRIASRRLRRVMASAKPASAESEPLRSTP